MTTQTLKTTTYDSLASRLGTYALAVLRSPGIALDYLAELQARETARRHLRSLDDHMLADIGATRDDIYREASKPVWQR